MTADEVRTFTEPHIEHWKALDAAAIAADHAPDGVVESPNAGTHQGHEAIRKALQKWFDSFPDMRFPTEQIVADADALRRSSSSPSRERRGVLWCPRRRPAPGVSVGPGPAVRERSHRARSTSPAYWPASG